MVRHVAHTIPTIHFRFWRLQTAITTIICAGRCVGVIVAEKVTYLLVLWTAFVTVRIGVVLHDAHTQETSQGCVGFAAVSSIKSAFEDISLIVTNIVSN